MPLGKGIRYRVVRRGKKKIRLAFKGKGAVLEAKNLSMGATHTPSEVRKDRKKRRKRRRY